MKQLHPLMLAGTGSDVGKSIVAAAFCRIFLQDGYQPAPFKAQNMALNSYATPEGLEIGRAQAVQAEAAGIPCHTDMNPLLLKPQSDHTSQVVLHGRPIGNKNAYEYWRKRTGEIDFRQEVCDAFDRLAARYWLRGRSPRELAVVLARSIPLCLVLILASPLMPFTSSESMGSAAPFWNVLSVNVLRNASFIALGISAGRWDNAT